LQGCVPKLQQFVKIPFGFAVFLHRNAMVAATKFSVNSAASAREPTSLIAKQIKWYSYGQSNRM
jgi:hypothetical protein